MKKPVVNTRKSKPLDHLPIQPQDTEAIGTKKKVSNVKKSKPLDDLPIQLQVTEARKAKNVQKSKQPSQPQTHEINAMERKMVKIKQCKTIVNPSVQSEIPNVDRAEPKLVQTTNNQINPLPSNSDMPIFAKRPAFSMEPSSFTVTSSQGKKICSPFWTPRSKDLTAEWGLASNINLADFLFENLEKSSQNFVGNSWYKVRFQQITEIHQNQDAMNIHNPPLVPLWQEILEEIRLKEEMMLGMWGRKQMKESPKLPQNQNQSREANIGENLLENVQKDSLEISAQENESVSAATGDNNTQRKFTTILKDPIQKRKVIQGELADKKKEPVKTRKIKLFPLKELKQNEDNMEINENPEKSEKEKLLYWMEAARITYNMCLARHKEENQDEKKPLFIEKYRKIFVNSENLVKNKRFAKLVESVGFESLHEFVEIADYTDMESLNKNQKHSQLAEIAMKVGFERLSEYDELGNCTDPKIIKEKKKFRHLAELSHCKNHKDLVKIQELAKLATYLDVPYSVRDGGLRDLKKNIAVNEGKIENGTIKKYEMKFRNRQKGESIVICRSNIEKKGVFSWILEIRSSESIEEINNDFRIIRDLRGNFYACLPIPLKISGSEPPLCAWNGGVIALDPGVRKFMTGFDPSGLVIFAGERDIQKIEKHCQKASELQSKMDQADCRHKRRYNLKKIFLRKLAKIHNLVEELHKKLCKFLCENYHVILIPTFKTQEMVAKKSLYDDYRRRINSKTARGMLSWCHYQFRERLKFKANEYPWTNVIEVTEEYTSKICGKCGEINENLGSRETFQCADPSCPWSIDRDVNGARNILIKYLTETF